MSAKCAALLAGLFTAGCVGTSLKVRTPYKPAAEAKRTYTLTTTASVTGNGLGILRERLEQRFRDEGLLAAPADRKVEIDVVFYRMRHGAARALVGIAAGADNIESTVVVRDAWSQVVLGEFTVESTNPTITSSARLLIEDHADKIVEYIKTAAE